MAAPELRLNVTLDLASFRSQLGKLAQTAAAYYYPVNLIIDKKNFEAQLKALGKIKPVININDDQLIAARTRIGTLNKSLATLRRATATPIEIKVKYVEVGKPPAGGTAEIGRAVSGGVRGSQAIEGFTKQQLQNTRKMMVTAGMAVGQMGNLAKATSEEYRKSIVQGFTNSGQEAINGFAAGLKDASSKIGAIAAKVGEEGVRGIKDALGIASPSKVFKQIGEFSVDGLELGFLNGLKDFKSKSVAEVKKIVALLRFELAKVSDISGPGGASMGSLRRQLVGRRAYTSPIGPLPVGSEAPYARGDRGQFGSSGYEPRMVSSPAGRAYPAAPNSFLGFSRGAGGYAQATSQAPSRTPSSFLGFSQRATQLQQSAAGGAPPSPPSPPIPPSGGGGRLRGQSTPLATPLSLDYYKNAFKYQAALQAATNFSRNFTASQIPLIGGLRNAAAEFGQAAKQVLIYGAAYKGLAFVAGLPGQILDAAKNQQQYTNALKVSTQETGTFAKEMLFIDNVQRAFGLNLETTRNGFVKLYASMAPTGFDSGSIEKLFTGISAATAALQLTPDKAERVIYAFGQMASKGQIMSEELKGQLGDVLPGALSIFAKAAGMSVKEFSKAMEDGEFTGNRFREVFAKVSDELINRFGTGAQVAGKSLQGLINTVGGDFTRTLESFAPLADSAAQATLAPLSRMLKDVGIAAQIAMGEVGRVQAQIKDAKQIVVDLKVGGAKPEQIKAAEQNVLALQMRYEQLNTALQDPAMAQRVNDIQKFTTELAKAGTFVMNMAGAIGNMLSPILNILGTNLTTVISLITSFYVGFQTARLAAMALMGALLLYRNLSVLLGFGAAANGARALAGAFGFLGVAVNGATLKTIGLRVALTALVSATVIGAVVGGIMLIAGAFASMADRAKEAADKSKQSIDSMMDAARTGNVAMIEMELSVKKADQQDLENLIKKVQQLKGRASQRGEPLITLTPELQREAKRLGAEVAGETRKGILMGSLTALRQPLKDVVEQGELSLQDARKRAERLGLNKPTLGTSGTNEGETEEDRKKREREEERRAKLQDKLANRDQQLAVDAANRRVALDQSTFDSRLRMSDAEYDHLRALQDDYFERQISGLDSIEARQKKHQQDLTAIENRRIDSIRKAELDAVKAVQDLRSASIKAAAVTGGAPGAAKFGDTGRTFNAPGFVHGHLQNMDRGALKGDATSLVKSLLQQGVTPELGSGAQFSRSMSDAQIADLVGRGIAAHKQYASGAGAIDIFVPKGTSVPAPLSNVGNLGGAAGVTGTMPGGSQLMHLDPSSKSSSVGLATRSGAFAMGRREDKAEGQLAVEQQDAQNRAVEKLATIRNANNLALQQTITLVKQNIDSIFPLREQQLENDLLELRNNLESKGVSKQMIDMEVEKAKRSKESALAAEVYTKKIDESTAALERYNKMKTLTPEDKSEMARLTAEIDLYKKTLADLPELQGRFNNELARTATLTTESSFESAMTSLKDRMKMAQAFTPGQELKTQIALDNPDLSPEQQQVLFDTTQATIKLEELKEKVKNISQSIGDALGNSLNSGIQGLIAGTANAQQIFSDFLKSMGDILIQEGVKMIATYTAIAIAKSLAGLFGGGGGGSIVGGDAFGGAASSSIFSAGTGTAFGGMSIPGFAEGGRPPIGRPSLVGELGPELFVPSSSGTIIPADATAAAMARYQRQGGGSGAGSSSDTMGAGAAATPVLSMSFETTRFLGQDYVSTDQLQAAMMTTERRAAAAGAKAGAAQITSKLQQSPAYRRQVGLR